MNRATASDSSIPKVVFDGSSVLPPGYKDEYGSAVQLPRPSSYVNGKENSSEPELPYIVKDLRRRTGKPESELTYMEAALFASVLEDFLTSLHVVGNCQSTLRRMKVNVDMDKLLAKKFGIANSPFAPDELAGITKENISCEIFKLKKLDTDRAYMEKVATETYIELALDRSCLQLVKANTEFETQVQRYPSIKEEEMKNRAIRIKLRKKLRLQQNINATQIRSYSADVDKLQEQLDHAHLLRNIKGRYLNSWQNSRIEQHEEFIGRKEKVTAEKIVKYKMKQEEESRVHSEMELVVGILINETLLETENLMVKYERDMEVKDLEIQEKRHMYEKMLKKRIKLEAQLAHKRDKIIQRRSYKEDQIRCLEYGKKMHNAASVVQAWWRGILVRQQLGPYRHKKKANRKNRSSNVSA